MINALKQYFHDSLNSSPRDSWELYNFMCKDEQFLKLNSNWV